MTTRPLHEAAMTRRTAGFTLIEILIALAILALLFGFALPSLSGALAASHSSAARASLLATLLKAVERSAITAQHVVVCSSSDGQQCSGSINWSEGWIAFLDSDQDRMHTSNEPMIVTEGPLDSRVRLSTTSGRTRLVFQPNGGNAGSNVTFTLCDTRGPARGQSLVLNNRGQLHEATPDPARLATTCP